MDDDADAVPLEQVREEPRSQTPQPSARTRISDNRVYEPSPQVNRPWDEEVPAYESAPLSIWEQFRYSLLVALLIFGALAIVLRWPAMLHGRDKALAIAAIAFCGGWAFHMIVPLLDRV